MKASRDAKPSPVCAQSLVYLLFADPEEFKRRMDEFHSKLPCDPNAPALDELRDANKPKQAGAK